MTRCYAYTRVSTVKQGEKGVSLQEQHAAIALYAERHGIHIAEWFEERLTAAKKGRPLFTKMLKKLRQGEAQGVVIHKIDRGARNLRDWADLGELIDAGVSVHFVNESLDLHSRGGRLSADIQAVVAADFIRNLREETRKGMYGRLKQGLYPFAAPVGYVDTGSGRVKTTDPLRGPLIREAFELYATGQYSLDSLLLELHRRGLRNRHGGAISRDGISRILNNPFYAGLIRLRSTGEIYPGNHIALVPMALFKQVEARLGGRGPTKWIHDFTLRRVFRCSLCTRYLIGERQKRHVYYRCHTRDCPTRGFREEILEAALLTSWPAITFTDDQKRSLSALLDYVESRDQRTGSEQLAQRKLQLSAIKARMPRLVDAFLDGHVDKQTFEERKRTLLEEQQLVEDSLRVGEADSGRAKQLVLNTLELASSAQQSYRLGSSASRRELAIRLCSNRSVAGKKVSVEPHPVLRVIANRALSTQCDPTRNRTALPALRRLCPSR